MSKVTDLARTAKALERAVCLLIKQDESEELPFASEVRLTQVFRGMKLLISLGSRSMSELRTSCLLIEKDLDTVSSLFQS